MGLTPDQFSEIKEGETLRLRKRMDENIDGFSQRFFNLAEVGVVADNLGIVIPGRTYTTSGIVDMIESKALKEYLVKAITRLIFDAGGYRSIEGKLELLSDGSGILRDVQSLNEVAPALFDNHDVRVPSTLVQHSQLRHGDRVSGTRRGPYPGEDLPVLLRVDSVRSDKRTISNISKVESSSETRHQYSQSVILTSFGAEPADARALAIQPDGRLLIAGSLGTAKAGTGRDLALTRYKSDGTLDETFGSKGKSIITIANCDSIGYAVGIQADNKIVIAGEALDFVKDSLDFVLVRLDENGIVDRSFNREGFIFTKFQQGSSDGAKAIAMQNDGKVLAAGYTAERVTESRKASKTTDVVSNELFALARYLPSGALDKTFGTNGLVTTPFPGAFARARAIHVHSDGKMVVAGFVKHGDKAGIYNGAAARYLPDGRVDESFGMKGRILVEIEGADNTFQAIAVQMDGRVILAGAATTKVSNKIHMLLVRLDETGKLDPTFNGVGFVLTAEFVGAIQGVAIREDGRILSSGYAIVHGQESSQAEKEVLALACYNADGSLDRAFGTAGVMLIDLGGVNDRGAALRIQDDGEIVVAGTRSVGQKSDFALVRVHERSVRDSAARAKNRDATTKASSSGKTTSLILKSLQEDWTAKIQEPTSRPLLAKTDEEMLALPDYPDVQEAFVWILDVPESEEVIAAVRGQLQVGLFESDKGTKECVLRLIDLYRTAKNENTQAQNLIRDTTQVEMISAMRANGRLMRFVAMYDAANVLIADEYPPLTKKMAICYYEFTSFVDAIHANTEWQPASAPERAHHTQILVSQYRKLPRQAREWLARGDELWQVVRAAWLNGHNHELLRHIILKDMPQWVSPFTRSAEQTPPAPQQTPPALPSSTVIPKYSSESPTAESYVSQIIQEGKKKEALAAQIDPQNQAMYNQVLTNISRMQFDSLMTVVRNFRA